MLEGYWKLLKDAITRNKTQTNMAMEYDLVQDWAYERYFNQLVTANRWQLAFWLQLSICLILGMLIFALLPLKTWEPIIVHRNSQTGEIWVESARDNALPINTAEVEANLVSYVVNRETYSYFDLNSRYKQIIYSSSPSVAKLYESLQNPNNPNSPMNVFGKEGTRIIKVQDVVFLDTHDESNRRKARNTQNLVKIDFVTTETKGLTTTQKYWVATMSWDYVGTPKEKEAAWYNWNGFMVTHYRVDQRNI